MEVYNNAIEVKRKRLSEKRAEFQRAVQSLTTEDMVDILADVYAATMTYGRGDTPDRACLALGEARGVLAAWYKRHQAIQEYHRLRNDLIRLERQEANG